MDLYDKYGYKWKRRKDLKKNETIFGKKYHNIYKARQAVMKKKLINTKTFKKSNTKFHFKHIAYVYRWNEGNIEVF